MLNAFGNEHLKNLSTPKEQNLALLWQTKAESCVSSGIEQVTFDATNVLTLTFGGVQCAKSFVSAHHIFFAQKLLILSDKLIIRNV